MTSLLAFIATMCINTQDTKQLCETKILRCLTTMKHVYTLQDERDYAVICFDKIYVGEL
jgi:hypothetical protein